MDATVLTEQQRASPVQTDTKQDTAIGNGEGRPPQTLIQVLTMEDYLASIAESLEGFNRTPWITYYNARLRASDGTWERLVIVYDPSEAVLKVTCTIDCSGEEQSQAVKLHSCDRNTALILAAHEVNEWQAGLSLGSSYPADSP